ncbi:hypothetical protein QR97_11290 [Streptomyces sp. PBH53]|uniref:hypothetical protein n=1 Tax=Streptomyces sp. PBH53 TaxID=1577075 RepID=UPI0006566CE3|nr:hypothetical protein [Streptomyces sp. PBH53]AKN70346.1 hypothetical protein QR97_11290 [Streptomyces sp. PBH53]
MQRRIAPEPSGAGHHGDGPATPLVTPSRAPAPAAAVTGAAGAAGDARRPGTASGQGSAAPVPVVVARAVAEGASGASDARPSGSPAGSHPLTVTRAPAYSVPAPARTLALLAARPLSLNTRPPEGVAAPAAGRSGARPVVAARWPGTPPATRTTPPGPTASDSAVPTASRSMPVQRAASHSAAVPGPSRSGAPADARTVPVPAQPTASCSAVPTAPHGTPAPPAPDPVRPVPPQPPAAPAVPGVQRAVADRSGPREPGGGTTVPAAPVQRVPVVRLAPPRADTPAAVPARPLPVTAPQAPPLTDRPAAVSAPAPAVTVPVVRRKSAAPGGGAAAPVQRSGSGAGDVVTPGVTPGASPGVSAKAAPTRNPQRPARHAEPPPEPGLDLDDLARRLLDPVARLLRAELRRGRDRTGRPHDGRR